MVIGGFTLHKSPYGEAGNVSSINYLMMWLSHWQIHKNPDDFVFASYTAGNKRIDSIGFREFPELYEQLTNASVGPHDPIPRAPPFHYVVEGTRY